MRRSASRSRPWYFFGSAGALFTCVCTAIRSYLSKKRNLSQSRKVAKRRKVSKRGAGSWFPRSRIVTEEEWKEQEPAPSGGGTPPGGGGVCNRMKIQEIEGRG